MKYSNITFGQMEAIVNKLGGMEGAESFLRGELEISEPTRAWREKDGVIYFTLTSDGKSGPEWIAQLESKRNRISDHAKQLLCSGDFQATSGVTYEIAILKGMLFNDCDRITKKIRAEAKQRKLITPNAEVACLIRDKFTDKEIKAMGLTWIITMHEPVKDSDGDPFLLYADRHDDGSWLNTRYDFPDRRWSHDDGFAFVLSQV